MTSWVIENLGWALLHSLWQILFITVALFCALRMFRDFSANLRYFAAVSALCLSFVLPVATFVYLSSDAGPGRAANRAARAVSQTGSSPEAAGSPFSGPDDVRSTSPANGSASAAVTNISGLTALVGFWFAGVFICAIRLLGGVWTTRHYRSFRVSAVEDRWQEKFTQLCGQLGIRRQVRIVQSAKIEIPMVIGWLKPVVLIPASAFLQITPKELETILIHELTHIRRNDYLVNFALNLVQILLFYHPGVWWIAARIRTEREFAVDEFVARFLETDRIVYAKALAGLEANRSSSATLVMAADGGNLMKRIENILGENRKLNSTNISIWSAVFAITFIIGISTGVYWLGTVNETKPRSGRKVAVIFSNYPNNGDNLDGLRKMFELQNEFQIPVTWILDSGSIDAARQNQMPPDFLNQAAKNRSDFIIEVPNINYTVFMNGDDDYINLWKERTHYIEENLAKTGYRLRYFSTGFANQIPQEMENYLAGRNLQTARLPKIDVGSQFHFYYEKDCLKAKTESACLNPNAEKQKEIREQYLQYMHDLFELNSNYYRERFGKEIPQVLPLGTRRLAVDAAEQIVQTLRDEGVEFVSLDELLSDETVQIQQAVMKDRDFTLRQFKLQEKYRRNDLITPRRQTESNEKIDYKVDAQVKEIRVPKQ